MVNLPGPIIISGQSGDLTGNRIVLGLVHTGIKWSAVVSNPASQVEHTPRLGRNNLVL